MIFVIPARRDSRRCANKNHREFLDGRSLTDLAVEFALEQCIHADHVIVVADDYDQQRCEVMPYPKAGGLEVDNSIQIWQYALRDCHDWLTSRTTTLIEPSCFRGPGVAALFNRAWINRHDGQTACAIAFKDRYGMKAHVFTPSGAFYIASVGAVMDGSVFDGPFDYYIDNGSINIDTEEQFMEAQNQRIKI